jgi:hypothetical protein
VRSDRNSQPEVVADAREADGAAHARLLAQRGHEAVQIDGERSGQRVGFPLVFFPVDDDGEVRLSHA